MVAEHTRWNTLPSAQDARTRAVLGSLIDAFTDPGAVDPGAAAMLVARCRALLDADASDGRVRGTAFDGRLTVIEDTSSPEPPLWRRLL